MAQIKIKGQLEPLSVSLVQAEKVKQVFMDEKIPDSQKIEIGDWVGKKGDIRSVIMYTEEKQKSGSGEMKDFISEHYTERKQFLEKSFDERASLTGFFGLIHLSAKGCKPDEETKQKAIVLQKKFFEKNQYRTKADPEIFFELLGVNKKTPAVIGYALPLIERVVSLDMFDAERDEKYHNERYGVSLAK